MGKGLGWGREGEEQPAFAGEGKVQGRRCFVAGAELTKGHKTDTAAEGNKIPHVTQGWHMS